MLFLESLFLYNVLEALVIILFCNLLNNSKFKIGDIKHCFILGAVNLAIQYINLLISNAIFQLLYNLGVMFILMPIISFLYFRFTIRKYNILYCFLACVFIFITSVILTSIFNNIFGIVFINTFINKYYDFIFNIVLRVFEILLIYLLYKGKCFIMKKLLKKIASASVEQAFTAMNQYQPKVPEKLAKEIAEKQ